MVEQCQRGVFLARPPLDRAGHQVGIELKNEEAGRTADTQPLLHILTRHFVFAGVTVRLGQVDERDRCDAVKPNLSGKLQILLERFDCMCEFVGLPINDCPVIERIDDLPLIPTCLLYTSRCV